MRLVLLLSCLSSLCACKPDRNPITSDQQQGLIGKYKVLTLIEEPYTDTAINDLVLFDGANQDCASQPVTLYFTKTGRLTITILPACKSSMVWLAGTGLIDASHWMLQGSAVGITPPRAPVKEYAIQFHGKQLELGWQAADSTFVGLKGELVTYSLTLQRL